MLELLFAEAAACCSGSPNGRHISNVTPGQVANHGESHAAPSVGLVNEHPGQIEGRLSAISTLGGDVVLPTQRDDRDPEALVDLEFNLGRRAVWFH